MPLTLHQVQHQDPLQVLSQDLHHLHQDLVKGGQVLEADQVLADVLVEEGSNPLFIQIFLITTLLCSVLLSTAYILPILS